VVQDVDPDRVLLAHSRFIRKHRQDIDEKMLKYFGKSSTDKERAGRIVICTQVLQESLDFDMDYGVSDLAPVDVLIQRFGRVRRHTRSQSGQVISGKDERGDTIPVSVLMPTFTPNPKKTWAHANAILKTSFVYSNALHLWRTAKLCTQMSQWSLPEDVRHLMETVYAGSGENPEGLKDVDLCARGESKGDQAVAMRNTLRWQNGYWGDQPGWTVDLEGEGTPTRLSTHSSQWRIAKFDTISKKIIPIVQTSY